ncbi:MAG TPA: hypothetical protein VHU84_03920 [Lacipirellulaceae bacterium]|jgi:hypothetical protein|nr:hypothetical protein [Lacipirellulaceae bacterium]
MNDESFEHIEQQIAALRPRGASVELRAAVLSDVQRELRAARLDRRLARAAVVMLVLGVGLNAVIGTHTDRSVQRQMTSRATQNALVQVAVGVAEATDAKTARLYARQLAAMTGRALSVDDTAAIDAATERAAPSTMPREKRG